MKISKNGKLIILLLAIILIVIMILFFSCNKDNDAKSLPNQITTSPKTIIENVTTNSMNKNINEVFFPYIHDNKLLYLGYKGIIFNEYNLDTKQNKKLFDQEILGTSNVYYSPDGKRAVIKSFYPENNMKLYNFENGSVKNISSNIIDLAWNEDGSKIAYIFNDNNNFQVNTTDNNFGDWLNIITLEKKILSPEMLFYIGNIIFYGGYPNSYEGTTLHVLNSQNKTDNEIENTTPSKDYILSPRKSKILFRTRNSAGQELFTVYNIKNNLLTDINILSSENDSFIWKNEDEILLYKNNSGVEEIQEINVNSKIISKIYKLNNPDKFYSYIAQLLISTDEKTLYLLSNNNYLYNMTLD